MSDLSDERLQELEALRAKATEAPWFFNSYSGIFGGPRIEYEDGDFDNAMVACVDTVAGDTASVAGYANAALIVAAVNALPGLISELQRRREEERKANVGEHMCSCGHPAKDHETTGSEREFDGDCFYYHPLTHMYCDCDEFTPVRPLPSLPEVPNGE